MTVQVKICGVRTEETLDAAIASGADFFGLVFYAASPRSVSRAQAAALVARAEGRARSVALLVDPDDQAVRAVVEEVKPDYVQLHGSERPARVREIRRIAGRPVIKAVRVATAGDAAAAGAFHGAADIILFDAKPTDDDDDALPGGNGVAFDWSALSGIEDGSTFFLSGGLDPDNVREAITRTGTRLVDVSSGVERAPGEKDPELIRRFIESAKTTPDPEGSARRP